MKLCRSVRHSVGRAGCLPTSTLTAWPQVGKPWNAAAALERRNQLRLATQCLPSLQCSKHGTPQGGLSQTWKGHAMAAACEETSDHRLQPDQSASCTPLALARLAPRTRAGTGPHVISTTVPTTMHGRLFPGATLCSPRGAGLMQRLRCKDRDTAICVHAEAARAWHDTQQPHASKEVVH